MVGLQGCKQGLGRPEAALRGSGNASGNLQPRGVGAGDGRGDLEVRSSTEPLFELPDQRLRDRRSWSQGVQLICSEA